MVHCPPSSFPKLDPKMKISGIDDHIAEIIRDLPPPTELTFVSPMDVRGQRGSFSSSDTALTFRSKMGCIFTAVRRSFRASSFFPSLA